MFLGTLYQKRNHGIGMHRPTIHKSLLDKNEMPLSRLISCIGKAKTAFATFGLHNRQPEAASGVGPALLPQGYRQSVTFGLKLYNGAD
jgi:hypothetical protein